MINIRHLGNFKNTEKFLNNAPKINYRQILEKYARQGVQALSSATPIESGKTGLSWGYEILCVKNRYSITFTNSNIVNGVNIAVILQYGHGTKNGGYVQGVDYINPAVRSVFDNIAKDAWREVTNI